MLEHKIRIVVELPTKGFISGSKEKQNGTVIINNSQYGFAWNYDTICIGFVRMDVY